MSFKGARMLANLTQEQVAMSLGLSRTTVSMWESGESKPRTEKLVALARLYNCTVDDLLKEEEETQHKAGQGVEMEREQTTIRLTIRMPEKLDDTVRREAERKGLSINQLLLSIINRSLR